MGTTTEKLARVIETKEALKSALKTRGQTVNDSDTFKSYANKVLNLAEAGSIKPSGTKTITSNGTHDVTSYASAVVNVPTGITPTGTKTITENGTHDVTSYASAVVNVKAEATPSIEWLYISIAGSPQPLYEITGMCAPHSYAQTFEESDWLEVCGDTYEKYGRNGLTWQRTMTGFWVMKNTPIIIWCPTSTKPSIGANALVFLNDTPIEKVMTDALGGTTQYYGYRCYFAKSGILW